MSLYHGGDTTLFGAVLSRLAGEDGVQAVALPRTAAQREALRAVASPSLVVPDRAVDALSLVALADLVVSAGGTMNREAVALGTPVCTTFAGRLGAVDEQLVRDGRLRRLTGADALALERRSDGDRPRTRPPATLLDLLLGAA